MRNKFKEIFGENRFVFQDALPETPTEAPEPTDEEIEQAELEEEREQVETEQVRERVNLGRNVLARHRIEQNFNEFFEHTDVENPDSPDNIEYSNLYNHSLYRAETIEEGGIEYEMSQNEKYTLVNLYLRYVDPSGSFLTNIIEVDNENRPYIDGYQLLNLYKGSTDTFNNIGFKCEITRNEKVNWIAQHGRDVRGRINKRGTFTEFWEDRDLARFYRRGEIGDRTGVLTGEQQADILGDIETWMDLEAYEITHENLQEMTNLLRETREWQEIRAGLWSELFERIRDSERANSPEGLILANDLGNPEQSLEYQPINEILTLLNAQNLFYAVVWHRDNTLIFRYKDQNNEDKILTMEFARNRGQDRSEVPYTEVRESQEYGIDDEIPEISLLTMDIEDENIESTLQEEVYPSIVDQNIRENFDQIRFETSILYQPENPDFEDNLLEHVKNQITHIDVQELIFTEEPTQNAVNIVANLLTEKILERLSGEENINNQNLRFEIKRENGEFQIEYETLTEEQVEQEEAGRESLLEREIIDNLQDNLEINFDLSGIEINMLNYQTTEREMIRVIRNQIMGLDWESFSNNELNSQENLILARYIANEVFNQLRTEYPEYQGEINSVDFIRDVNLYPSTNGNQFRLNMPVSPNEYVEMQEQTERTESITGIAERYSWLSFLGVDVEGIAESIVNTQGTVNPEQIGIGAVVTAVLASWFGIRLGGRARRAQQQAADTVDTFVGRVTGQETAETLEFNEYTRENWNTLTEGTQETHIIDNLRPIEDLEINENYKLELREGTIINNPGTTLMAEKLNHPGEFIEIPSGTESWTAPETLVINREHEGTGQTLSEGMECTEQAVRYIPISS